MTAPDQETGRETSSNGFDADLVIRDVEIFDGRAFLGRGDVAVRQGRISALGPRLGARGREERSFGGALLTPGWVDLHTHIDVRRSFWGIDPAGLAWATGVTTWVDAGSAGLYGIDGLLADTADLPVRIPVLLNASAIGLVGSGGEASQERHFPVPEAVTAATRLSNRVKGIKIRLSDYTLGDLGLVPLARALDIAAQAGLPLMVHIGGGIPFAEVFDALRPGDIVTHACTPALRPELEHASTIDALAAAHERGVVLDLGHGSGSFSYAVAERLLELGIVPQSFSSDLHLHSRHGVVRSLPDVLSRVLALGIDPARALAGVTSGPAQALGLDAGALHVGAPADLAVFDQVEEIRHLADSSGETRETRLAFRNVATFLAGAELEPRYLDEPPGWLPVSRERRAALAERASLLRQLLLDSSDRPTTE